MICLSEVSHLIVLFLNFHEIFSGIFSNCSVLGETYTSDISRKKPGSCILTAILKHYSAFFSISETKSLIKLKPALKRLPDMWVATFSWSSFTVSWISNLLEIPNTRISSCMSNRTVLRPSLSRDLIMLVTPTLKLRGKQTEHNLWMTDTAGSYIVPFNRKQYV